MTLRTEEHTFSIELNSKDCLGIEVPRQLDDSVLVEGSLGKLSALRFVEGVMLEIKGSNGTFRMDITESEWVSLLKKGSKHAD
ncbi:MAG: hypothetical protein ACFFER_05420 [Candidatus Thorarchaeota archaeon]